jgi:hypothetical protein
MRFIVTAAWLVAMALAASTAQAAEPVAVLTAPAKHELIKKLVSRLTDVYVFPDRAASAGAALVAADRSGEFDSITDPTAFAKALTDKLAANLHDKHLRVRYSSQELKPDSGGGDQAPTPQQFDEMRRGEATFNFGIEKAMRLRGNIGYLDVRGFPSATLMGDTLATAMKFVSNTDALIIDLRKNHGGDPAAVALFCSYLLAPAQEVHINDIYTRTAGSTTGTTQQYWTTYVPGPLYLDKQVFVLTSSRTFSGGEEFAYDMQTQKRATLIGETTGGGANPGDVVVLDSHFSVFLPSGRAINPITNTNWEGVGVKPDISTSADDALGTAYLMLLRKKVAAATNPDVRQALSTVIDDTTKNPGAILLQ